jgi:octaprenyl-diphosphate synthase
LQGVGGPQNRQSVSVCGKLGALVAGADPQTEERLGEFAWNLGMAFQGGRPARLHSRDKVLGKSVGEDLREGRVTLPLVCALELASGEERRRVELILRDRNYDRVPFPQILATVECYQGIARVKERAQAFTEKARGIIGEFPDSLYQRALYIVTDLLTERDH